MSLPPLGRNIALNLGARGITTLLAFITIPVVFNRLGPERYGVFVLALTIGGLFNLLDLGLTPAIIMSVSRAWHRGADSEVQNLIGTAFSLFIGIGLVGGAILALLVPLIVTSLLHVPPGLRSDAQLALWLSAAAFALNMWLAVFNAVPVALERYDLLAARTVFLSVVSTSLTIIYALLGGSLIGLVLINVLTTMSGLFLFYRVSRSLLPSIHFRPGFHPASFRLMGRFSAFKFAGTVGGIAAFRFDQFAIGAIINVSAVGYYAIPANGASRIFSILSELVQPLFPRASKLRDDQGAVRELFLNGTRAIFLLATLGLSIVFVFADFILRYWIHGTRGIVVANQSTAALRWLTLAFLIQAAATVPALFSEALGKPEINNGFSLAGAAIHIPLVLLLVPRYGITGAALALFINSLVQTVAFIVVASWFLAGIGAWELIGGSLARPLAAACLAGGVGFLLRGMVHGVVTLAVAGALMALVYLVLAFLVTAIRPNDLRLLRRAAHVWPARVEGLGP